MICFRTEIGPLRGSFEIGRDDRIVLLGSCFADNIGSMLEHDGFHAVHNPLGPLYNPVSLLVPVTRGPRPYTPGEMYRHGDSWHCLDYAARYSGDSPEQVAEAVNTDYLPLAEAIARADVLILTLGTARAYTLDGRPVGNCHKLPAATFGRRMMRPEDIVPLYRDALPRDKRLIVTVSPVRYTADGLPDGALSKAVLRLAAEDICAATGADYFPAFEILNDDLRDYRFYGPDLKHPTELAAQYIYDKFGEAYFSPATRAAAALSHKQWLRSQHRPIITT